LKVVLYGATGKAGSVILKELFDRGQTVIAATPHSRKSAKGEEGHHSSGRPRQCGKDHQRGQGLGTLSSGSDTPNPRFHSTDGTWGNVEHPIKQAPDDLHHRMLALSNRS
jgi:nucleoside-diphosphate-sugar epimerase